MQKYTKGEGKLEVLRGLEAQALNDHFAKTGKRAVSEYDEQELEDLNSALEDARAKQRELDGSEESDSEEESE